MKKLSPKNGFTLLELLVVIAIIGVLSAIVISSVSTARAKGRDAKRKSDLHQIQNAIELYIVQNDHAPDMGDSNCLDVTNMDNSCFANETNSLPHWNQLEAQLSPYLKKLPKDPCGASCWDGTYGMYGFFSYIYEAPALKAGANGTNTPFGPVTSSSYNIYAERMETGSVSNGNFGYGYSF